MQSEALVRGGHGCLARLNVVRHKSALVRSQSLGQLPVPVSLLHQFDRLVDKAIDL
jgi:hypothetical protein